MSGTLNLKVVAASERHHEKSQLRGVYNWDPRVKFALLMIAVILNVGFVIPWLSGVLLAIGMVLLLWTSPHLERTVLFFLAPFIPTIITVFGFSIGFGETPIYQFGGLTMYTEGMVQGTEVALRVYCDLTWLALIFITTPFARVLDTLRWYKVPSILVDTLAMMYRYSFLLFEESTRMYLAAESRGGRSGKRKTMGTVARIGAQIFMRALDRSERIYRAKVSRGGE